MKWIRYFSQSAGALLLAVVLALLLSNGASWELAQPRDPVLLVSIRTLHWVVGFLSIILAAICLFGKWLPIQAAGVIWLAANFWIYVIGLRLVGAANIYALLGSVPETFGLSREVAGTMVQVVFGYLLLLGLVIWFWPGLRKRHREWVEAQTESKMSCIHCDGHVAFTLNQLGQTIGCPHCGKNIALRRPGSLKMSCFFCQGHIEFPSNAIGSKMPCPHCKMDITLLEPK